MLFVARGRAFRSIRQEPVSVYEPSFHLMAGIPLRFLIICLRNSFWSWCRKNWFHKQSPVLALVPSDLWMTASPVFPSTPWDGDDCRIGVVGFDQREWEGGSRMGMAFSKRRKNPLPAEEETFCFALPEALPEVRIGNILYGKISIKKCNDANQLND